jgi:Tol biopolymer transport system component
VFTTGSDLWSVAVRDGKPDGIPNLVRAGVGQVDAIGVTPSGTLYYALFKEVAQQIEVRAVDAPGIAASREAPVGMQGRTPVWSPDGRTLAYSRIDVDSRTADVVTRSLDTREERVYAGTGPDALLTSPMWTPDGSALVAGTFHRIDLKTGDVRPGPALAVPSDLNVNFRCGLSPDGRLLYAALFRRTNGVATFVIGAFDTATGELRKRLPVQGEVTFGRAVLSPDGRAIVVEHKVDGELRLSRIDVDGGPVRTLARGLRVTAGPVSWTPDSRAVSFVVDGSVMRLSANGGVPEDTGSRVAGLDDSGLLTVALSPDGTRAAIWRYLGGVNELWALDLPASLQVGR